MYEQSVTILVVAVVLGMDAFSLAMGLGVNGVSRRYELKFAGVVGIFHILMPLAGLQLGLTVGKILGIWAARLGAAVLAYIAVEFLVEGYRQVRAVSFKFNEGHKFFRNNRYYSVDQDLKGIILLGLSVSVDALTVGFGLGTLRMPVLITALIMGTVAGIMTLLGFLGGRVCSRFVGIYAQMLGGLILLILAVKMVI